MENDLGPGGQNWSQRAERGQPGGLRKLPRAHGQRTARHFPIPGTPKEPSHSSRADDPQVLGVSSGGGESLKSKVPQRTKRRWLSGRVERATRAEEPTEGRYSDPWPQKTLWGQVQWEPQEGSPLDPPALSGVPPPTVEQAHCSGCPKAPKPFPACCPNLFPSPSSPALLPLE